MKHAMIDIETMGTKPDTPILSVAVATFDEIGHIGDTFHQFVTWETAFTNRTPSPETICWWLEQNDEARKALITDKEKFPLSTVLINLSIFLCFNYYVWSNGATFDIAILENAYDQYNLSTPWHFRYVRDMRTIKMLKLIDADLYKPEIAHDSLSDAKAQARYVSDALYTLETMRS